MTGDLETFHDTLDIRYERSTPRLVRAFLTRLRDDAVLVGGGCACGHVEVPPRETCPACGDQVDDVVELEGTGEVVAWTRDPDPPDHVPWDGPVAFAVVRLDGASNGFVHAVPDDVDALEPGARVRARFRDEREGSLLDVAGFEVVP